MARRIRNMKFQPGDLVRMTAKWMRSVGKVSSNRLDGVVVGHSGPSFVIVMWNDSMLPRSVGDQNIEKKKTAKSHDDLILAARAASGIPIGKPHDGYQVLTHKGIHWNVRHGPVDTKREAERLAETVYDAEGVDVVITDPDGFLVLALDRDFSAKKNPARQKNTHDVSKSAKSASGALVRAESDLAAASGFLVDAGPGALENAVQSLLYTAFFLGVAQTHDQYSQGATDQRERIYELIGHMKDADWAQTVAMACSMGIAANPSRKARKKRASRKKKTSRARRR